MAWHLKLRDHANAARSCILHQLARLLLRVEKAIGTQCRQLRIDLALDAEALVFRQVPMKDVQLYRRHRIQIPLQHIQRLVVPATIDHQTAPAETRIILHRGGLDHVTVTGRLGQLQQRLHAVQGAHRGRRLQVNARCGHLQRVALVLVRPLHRLAITCHIQHDRPALAVADGAWQGNARLVFHPL